MSQLFASGGQSVAVLTSASVFPMNIQGWFPLGLTGLISLLSQGLSRIFSSSTIQKHQFFGTQPYLWSNSHICTWILEKLYLWLDRPLSAKESKSFIIISMSVVVSLIVTTYIVTGVLWCQYQKLDQKNNSLNTRTVSPASLYGQHDAYLLWR